MAEFPGAFEDTLAAARRGDEREFAALWRWLHPPLLRWLTVVAGHDEEDIASEVWLSIARGLDRFVGDDQAFRRWVFTIARRRAIDRGRREARQPKAAPLDGIEPVDVHASSSSLVDRTADLAVALALLQQLSPDQREVVALRVIVGMTVAETAAIVGKSVAAVRVLCHRGLRNLARRVGIDELAEASA